MLYSIGVNIILTGSRHEELCKALETTAFYKCPSNVATCISWPV